MERERGSGGWPTAIRRPEQPPMPMPMPACASPSREGEGAGREDVDAVAVTIPDGRPPLLEPRPPMPMPVPVLAEGMEPDEDVNVEGAREDEEDPANAAEPDAASDVIMSTSSFTLAVVVLLAFEKVLFLPPLLAWGFLCSQGEPGVVPVPVPVDTFVPAVPDRSRKPDKVEDRGAGSLPPCVCAYCCASAPGTVKPKSRSGLLAMGRPTLIRLPVPAPTLALAVTLASGLICSPRRVAAAAPFVPLRERAPAHPTDFIDCVMAEDDKEEEREEEGRATLEGEGGRVTVRRGRGRSPLAVALWLLCVSLARLELRVRLAAAAAAPMPSISSSSSLVPLSVAFACPVTCAVLAA